MPGLPAQPTLILEKVQPRFGGIFISAFFLAIPPASRTIDKNGPHLGGGEGPGKQLNCIDGGSDRTESGFVLVKRSSWDFLFINENGDPKVADVSRYRNH